MSAGGCQNVDGALEGIKMVGGAVERDLKEASVGVAAAMTGIHGMMGSWGLIGRLCLGETFAGTVPSCPARLRAAIWGCATFPNPVEKPARLHSARFAMQIECPSSPDRSALAPEQSWKAGRGDHAACIPFPDIAR